MKLEDLRRELQGCNLSKLSRDSGVHIRTLRRIKYGRSDDVMVGTINKVKPHLRASKATK